MNHLAHWAASYSAASLIMICFFVTSTAAGQSTASIVGTVMDSSGAAVPGASVTAINVQTGFQQTRTSGPEGAYSIPLLPVGDYRLEAGAAGFRRYVRSGIVLAVNDRPTIDIILEIGDVTESVTVTAAAPLLETQTGTLRGLVDQQRIVDLPLNGRNVPELLQIQAGVVFRGGDNRQGYRYSVNGNRQSGVAYLMDSGYNTDSYLNYSGVFPNPDAVQEFSIQKNNFSAEYANATGAIVNVVTKSGTNQFHGSAFEFIRNKVFNARNFFAAERDTLKRHQYGGTLGGPILKDKLFFFGTYQATPLRSDPRLSRIFLPTTAMRRGDYSTVSGTVRDPITGQPFPGQQIPVNRFSAVSLNWLKYLPDPGTPDGQLLSGTPTVRDTHEYMGRLDFHLARHRLTGKYFYYRENEALRVNLENLALPQNRARYYPYRHLSLNHIYTASPTLLNSANFSFRWRQSTLTWKDTKFPIDMVRAGVKNLAFHPPEFYLSVSGYFTASVAQFYQKTDWDLHWANTVSYFRGRHELRFGGEVIRSSNEIQNHYQTMGEFYFTGAASGHAIADFLIGDLYRFLQGGGEFKDLKGNRYGLFVQDDYRPRSNLTLNLGLRWDPVFPFTDDLGRVQCYRPGLRSTRFVNAPAGYLSAGDAGCPEGGFDSKLRIFSPRIGFAWRPGSGKTVIRGGGGVFWNPQFTIAYNQFVNSAPFSPIVELFGRRFEDPYGVYANPFPESFAPFVPRKDAPFYLPLGTFGSFGPGYRPSYTQSFNLTVEREMARNVVARVSYVSNAGRQLSYARDVNYARYVPGNSTVANMQDRRPNRDMVSILEADAGSNSSYHALQVSVERRLASNLSFEANYVWSKVIDEYSIDATPGDVSMSPPQSRRLSRAVADFDITHRFVVSHVWALPKLSGQGRFLRAVLGSWQNTGIWIFQDGTPFSVRSGVDNAFSGINRDNADLVGNPFLDPGRPRNELINQYFNTAAFRTNALGTFGTAPRNLLRAPGSSSVDLALMKNFPMTEKITLQLRAEFFNAFNTPRFSAPYAIHRVSNRFGRLESAADPRIIQLALKLSF